MEMGKRWYISSGYHADNINHFAESLQILSKFFNFKRCIFSEKLLFHELSSKELCNEHYGSCVFGDTQFKSVISMFSTHWEIDYNQHFSVDLVQKEVINGLFVASIAYDFERRKLYATSDIRRRFCGTPYNGDTGWMLRNVITANQYDNYLCLRYEWVVCVN